jgi:hypothetical protein
METFRMNREVVKISKLGEESPNYEYWLTQSQEKRISAIEFLRKQYDGTQSRLQRVYRITNLKGDLENLPEN